LADILAGDSGLGQGGLDRDAAELMRGSGRESAEKGAHRGALRGGDDDVGHGIFSSTAPPLILSSPFDCLPRQALRVNLRACRNGVSKDVPGRSFDTGPRQARSLLRMSEYGVILAPPPQHRVALRLDGADQVALRIGNVAEVKAPA